MTIFHALLSSVYLRVSLTSSIPSWVVYTWGLLWIFFKSSWVVYTWGLFLIFSIPSFLHGIFLVWHNLSIKCLQTILVEINFVNDTDIHFARYVDLTGLTRTRSNHNFQLRPRVARPDYFKFSFSNCYVNDWNYLPNFAMSASSLNSFKMRLLNYLSTLFYFVTSKWDLFKFYFLSIV